MNKNIFKLLSSSISIALLFLSTSILANEEEIELLPKTVKEAKVAGLGVIKPGMVVQHKKFGLGTVKEIQNNGEISIVNIIFEQAGSKWLVAEYAGLTIKK